MKIDNIEAGQKWWYYSCPHCHNEIAKSEGRFSCTTYQKFFTVGERRYKFLVLASDSTKAFDFLLLDRAAKRMIGKTATKLLSENLKVFLATLSKLYICSPADLQQLFQNMSTGIVGNRRISRNHQPAHCS